MTAASFRRLVGFYFNGVFAKFLLAGGLAAAANFAARLVLQPWTGFAAAVVLAYLVGFVTAFVLNRAFVFPASGKPLRHEVAWFLVFNLIAFPVVVGVAILLRDHLFGRFLAPGPAETVAHACAILTPVVFNFAAHRLVTFRAGEARR
ncbi:GtrA family protein [Phenylobacterium hankyongense]|uniref:GtrA family protein n=1 Tax=Phenylobacterium hankyongense TaxID=1813876 RepID=UPI0014038ED6|nr:GtrA family protein [Phenylobacterium hankyongense]